MTRVKKGDFIEINYVGRVKQTNEIFDLTDEKLAHEQNLQHQHHLGPVIICVGESQILNGLDENLIGKETGKNYRIELNAEYAFGKKDASLMKIIPISVFQKQNINVFPGMQVSIDKLLGIVRVASGGRVIVDFNHPLAGKDVFYELTISRIIEDKKEAIQSFFHILGVAVEINITNDIASISLEKEIPKAVKEELSNKIKRLMKIDVNFIEKRPLENNKT